MIRKGTLNAITVNLLHASVQVNAECRVLWTRKCVKIVQDDAEKGGDIRLDILIVTL